MSVVEQPKATSESSPKKALSLDQAKWLRALMGAKVVGDEKGDAEPGEPRMSKLDESEAWQAREQEKQRRLNDMRRQLEVIQDEVRMGMTFGVEVPGFLPGTTKQIKSLDDEGFKNVQEQLDTEHHQKELAKSKDPELAKKLQRATEAIGKLDRLKNELTADFEGEPLFTDREIMDEFYKPLVREAVMPENFVPPRWNETFQTFRGASDAWNEQLEAEASKVNVVKGLALAKRASGRLGDLADLVADLASVPPIIEAAISLTGAIAEATFGTLESAVAKDYEGMYLTFGDFAGNLVGDALGQPQLGKLVTTGIISVATGFDIAKNVASKERSFEFAVFSIIELFGVGLDNVCQSSDVEELVNWGKVAKEKYKKAVKPARAIELLNAGNHKSGFETLLLELKAAFASAVEEDVEGLRRAVASDRRPDESEDQAFERLLEQLQQAADAREAEQIRSELQSFSESLCVSVGIGLTADDTEAMQLQADFYEIDKIIARMARDQLLLKTVESLVDAGLKTAAELFEPLQLASAGKDLIKDFVLAAIRTKELKDWIGLRKDAIRAASVQGFAFANHIENLKIEISDKALDMVFELGKMTGGALAIVGLAGYGAGATAGVVVSKVSTGVQILKNLIKDVVQELQCIREWKRYKECLANPHDLILVRKSILNNPTLAKYTMAYAAVELNDPIAKMGMQQAGLCEETLRHPETNAAKVVEYLTLQWDYERQVKGSLSPKSAESWRVNPLELTMASWTANKQAACAKAKLDEECEATGAIDGALVDFLRRTDEFSQAADARYEEIAAEVRQCRDAAQPATLFARDTARCERATSSLDGSRQRFEQALQDFDQPLDEGDEPLKAAKKRRLALLAARDELLDDLSRRVRADESCERTGEALRPVLDELVAKLAQAAESVTQLATLGQDAILAGDRMIGHLRKYRPIDELGSLHQEFNGYVQELLDLAEREKGAVAGRAEMILALQTELQDLQPQLPSADQITETIAKQKADRLEAEEEIRAVRARAGEKLPDDPEPLDLPRFAFTAEVWSQLEEACRQAGIALTPDFARRVQEAVTSFDAWRKQRDPAERAKIKETAQIDLMFIVANAAQFAKSLADKRVKQFIGQFRDEARKRLDEIERISAQSSGPDWVPPRLKSMPMTGAAYVELRDMAAKSKGLHVPKTDLEGRFKELEKRDAAWRESVGIRLPPEADPQAKDKALQEARSRFERLQKALEDLVKALSDWAPRYAKSFQNDAGPHPGMEKYRTEMLSRARARQAAAGQEFQQVEQALTA